jgi:hypothetical protein
VFPNSDPVMFMVAFYGCLLAELVPVPVEVPLTRKVANLGQPQLGALRFSSVQDVWCCGVLLPLHVGCGLAARAAWREIAAGSQSGLQGTLRCSLLRIFLAYPAGEGQRPCCTLGSWSCPVTYLSFLKEAGIFSSSEQNLWFAIVLLNFYSKPYDYWH